VLEVRVDPQPRCSRAEPGVFGTSHCIGVRPLSRERSRSASSTSSAGRPSLVVAST
jgi:hypothetical protein